MKINDLTESETMTIAHVPEQVKKLVQYVAAITDERIKNVFRNINKQNDQNIKMIKTCHVTHPSIRRK